MRTHLVRFEAWNITQFLFGTNKRREIAGASELVTYLDRRWVHTCLQTLFPSHSSVGQWRIEEHKAELLEAGAGSVLVLVRELDDARRLVTLVTSLALTEAPGLDVVGVISRDFEWENKGALDAMVMSVHRESTSARTGRPGPDTRFQRLRTLAECASTGLPATVPLSLVRRAGRDRHLARLRLQHS